MPRDSGDRDEGRHDPRHHYVPGIPRDPEADREIQRRINPSSAKGAPPAPAKRFDDGTETTHPAVCKESLLIASSHTALACARSVRFVEAPPSRIL
jgi:hypothetical protein